MLKSLSVPEPLGSGKAKRTVAGVLNGLWKLYCASKLAL